MRFLLFAISNFILSVSKPYFNVPNFDLQTQLINIGETETMKLELEKSTNHLFDIDQY